MGPYQWTILLLFCVLEYGTPTASAPTWPSVSDELEDIMFLNTGYRARGFAIAVTPCSFSAQGNGRIAAAEWIRTAFHDMATANTFTGTGGIDASLIYELGGDNIGPAFQTTLETFSPFLTKHSSMADVIALGVYTAVRSCQGPVIPIRTGRIDATEAGPPGVPLPQNSLFTLEQQFLRTGFSTSEMIAVTACGHTIGGVHAEDFPQIVPSGTGGSSFPHFDTTTKFDAQIAIEWIDDNTTDPLSVGPSIASGRASDARVFNADGNVTMKGLTDPATFASTCTAMLQKLIEVVPSNVTLTDPIVPYDIKPTALQLTVTGDGSNLLFEGEIRVRTTTRSASDIASVSLVYKDRTGLSSCTNCKITTTAKGNAAGFDDSFTFYAFSTPISAQTSISSFDVVVKSATGAQIYGNNGDGFPVQDKVMLQTPQSCVDGSGALTVVAAVRSGSSTPDLVLSFQTSSDTTPFPVLGSQTVPMVKKSTLGVYDLYSASYTLEASSTSTAKFDIRLADGSEDAFKNIGDLTGTCSPLNARSVSTQSRK